MSVQPLPVLTDGMLLRVCGEYLEMPGLRVTQKQAQRLWGLDEAVCAQVLDFLVKARFLRRSDVGSYARWGEGAVVLPELRMAHASLPPAAATRTA